MAAVTKALIASRTTGTTTRQSPPKARLQVVCAAKPHTAAAKQDTPKLQGLAAGLAAAVLLTSTPFYGTAQAAQTPVLPNLAEEAGQSSLPNPFFGRSKKENKSVQSNSSEVQESIASSSSGKENEAQNLARKLNSGNPKGAGGIPSTAGVGQSLGTTDGGL